MIEYHANEQILNFFLRLKKDICLPLCQSAFYKFSEKLFESYENVISDSFA